MKYRLIVCSESDYKAWKNDEMLLDMNTNNLMDMVIGVKLRNKVLRFFQKNCEQFITLTIYPKTFEDLHWSAKQQGAVTYSEFKELTEHVDKKIVNGVVALLVKDV